MFRRSLLWQLYPVYLLIIVIALFTITWYLSWLLPDFYHNQVAEGLQARANLIKDQFLEKLRVEDFKGMEALCKELGKSSSTRITIILPNGKVAADSEENPADMENHSNRPEFKDAFEEGIGKSVRFSHTLDQNMMYLAVPIKEQGKILAVVRTSVPVVAVNEKLYDLNNKIILSAIIVAICAAIATLIVSRRISQPIKQMKETAQRFALGQLELRVPLLKQGELTELAQALNEMAQQLQDRIQTITQQRNELKAILSSMVEGVVAIDSNGYIVNINEAAANFLNTDIAKAQGSSIEEVIRNTEFQEFIKGILNEEQSGQTDVVLSGREDRIVRLDGANLTDSKGGKSGAVIVISDMTRMRRLEDVRRDFVANVSHELRTPITSIKGFVETLLEGAIQNPQQAERFLRIIAKHSDRLNAIVEDLLSLSSLEEGSEKRKITFEKTSLKHVLDSVIAMSMIKAEVKDITIELDCDESIEVKINTNLLEQAILNLVDNAIKYSEPAGKVQIKAYHTNKTVVISVRDYGCGIPRIHQSRIFERFYVIDKSRSRKLGGTGLGLAIVKHIAEVHGGKVTIESSPGAGSTFFLHLPAEY
jgi:two-component system phosphate regulon sensor histidine kinase PhoR